MKLKWKEPMVLTCRVEGTNGKIRELSAAIDFNYAYCCILRMDAIDLGYGEVTTRPEDWKAIYTKKVPYVVGLRGIEMAFLVRLKEISLGDLVVKDIDAVALKWDIPHMFPVDIILGMTFLGNFKLTVDPKLGYLALTDSK